MHMHMHAHARARFGPANGRKSSVLCMTTHHLKPLLVLAVLLAAAPYAVANGMAVMGVAQDVDPHIYGRSAATSDVAGLRSVTLAQVSQADRDLIARQFAGQFESDRAHAS